MLGPDLNLWLVHWISFKYRESFHGCCFICIESADGSHCSKFHREILSHFIEIHENRETFLSLNFWYFTVD